MTWNEHVIAMLGRKDYYEVSLRVTVGVAITGGNTEEKHLRAGDEKI